MEVDQRCYHTIRATKSRTETDRRVGSTLFCWRPIHNLTFGSQVYRRAQGCVRDCPNFGDNGKNQQRVHLRGLRCRE